MSRTAHCCCGALRAEVSGERALVVACHCEQCQRRTGTAFGVSAYFPADQVCITGPSKVFSRESQARRKVEMHFCPECGTTVFWDAAFMPGHVGIAAGAFSDPAFPPPTISAWERSKHPCITLAKPILHLSEQTPA